MTMLVMLGRSRVRKLFRSARGFLPAGAVFAMLLSTCPAARAQWRITTDAPSFSGVWNLVVGSGAEYEVRCSFAPKCLLQLAIVDEQRVGAREEYWLEVSSRREGGAAGLVNKLRFYRADRNRIVFTAGVVQVPGNAPEKLPDAWLESWARGDLGSASGYIAPPARTAIWGEGRGDPDQRCGAFEAGCVLGSPGTQPSEIPAAVDLGPETVTTPAGVFRCEHWKYEHGLGDVWLQNGAGPFGVVKAELDRKEGGNAIHVDMLLKRVLTNARDRITGNPLPPDPTRLLHRIWQQRNSLTPMCLPHLGLPTP
jgi:hypothetical protein